MYLKSLSGKILFEGRFHSVRQGVEMAIAEGVNLSGANLRKANLLNAMMDGANLKGACFWGANLTGADMAGCDLSQADFRTASLAGVCLAQADATKADFSGAYFSRTIIREADLTQTRFSCPSLFTLDLNEAGSLKNAIYCHRGEVDCDLSMMPIVIRGLEKPLVFMGDKVLIGTELNQSPIKEMIFNFLKAQTSPEKIPLKQSDCC